MSEKIYRKGKQKGKICSPPAATAGNHKDTKHWCKGVVGREHKPETLYSSPFEETGLMMVQRLACSVCKKQLDGYDNREASHEFGDIVRAIRTASGVNVDALAKTLGWPTHFIVSIETKKVHEGPQAMKDVLAALGYKLEVTVKKIPAKGKSSWRGLRVAL